MPQNYYINGECRIRWQKELAKCQGEATRPRILSGPPKVVKQIMAWHRNIWNSCHMYMRDWRQLQELRQEMEDTEKEWGWVLANSGNCTRNAAGPKLSQNIHLQSVVFFIVGLFMSIMTVKTFLKAFFMLR